MTLAELSKKNGFHSTQIGTWKRAAIENMATAFTRRGAAPEKVSIARFYALRRLFERTLEFPSRAGSAKVRRNRIEISQ